MRENPTIGTKPTWLRHKIQFEHLQKKLVIESRLTYMAAAGGTTRTMATRRSLHGNAEVACSFGEVRFLSVGIHASARVVLDTTNNNANAAGSILNAVTDLDFGSAPSLLNGGYAFAISEQYHLVPETSAAVFQLLQLPQITEPSRRKRHVDPLVDYTKSLLLAFDDYMNAMLVKANWREAATIEEKKRILEV